MKAKFRIGIFIIVSLVGATFFLLNPSKYRCQLGNAEQCLAYAKILSDEFEQENGDAKQFLQKSKDETQFAYRMKVLTDNSNALKTLGAKSCDAGIPEGCMLAGKSADDVIAKSPGERGGFDFFMKACQIGFKEGCDNASNHFFLSPFSSKDRGAKAEILGQLCIEYKVREACDKGAEIHIGNTLNKPVDAAKAIALYEQGCALGSADACVNIGRLYKEPSPSVTIKQDLAKALAYFEQACNIEKRRCFDLGLAYQYGRGVKLDLIKAASYYKLDCGEGEEVSCENLSTVKNGIEWDLRIAKDYARRFTSEVSTFVVLNGKWPSSLKELGISAEPDELASKKLNRLTLGDEGEITIYFDRIAGATMSFVPEVLSGSTIQWRSLCGNLEEEYRQKLCAQKAPPNEGNAQSQVAEQPSAVSVAVKPAASNEVADNEVGTQCKDLSVAEISSKQAFNTFVNDLRDSIAAWNKESVATDLVSYPLRVNGRKQYDISSPAELIQKFDEIFIGAITKTLIDTTSDSVFCNAEGVSFGNGDIWVKQVDGKIGIFSINLPVSNPSFDCAKASTPTEKMICDDPELGALDLKLAQVYKLALAGTPTIKSEQKDWLKITRTCPDIGCLINRYETRIDELSKVTTSQ
jgi:TPR repeat protein